MYFFSSPLKSGSSKAPVTLQQKQPKLQALSTARANTTLRTQPYNKRLNSSWLFKTNNCLKRWK